MTVPVLEDHLLAELLPWLPRRRLWVGFSGGLDSSVLLHALCRLSRRQALPEIRAVHVHHGLQTQADGWVVHCQAVCASLGVPLQVRHVHVTPGNSLEQGAREARYQAYAECLAADELLLLGQHRDDQAETLLYRLLRGAGVRGLAAMPRSRQLAAGHLLRPLLDLPRATLQAYAQAQGLHWIDDPSNTDYRFARNFLRGEILPRLQQHWPRADEVLARAAALQGEAAQLLGELAEQDLASCQAPPLFDWLEIPQLNLEALCQLSEVRQRNLLRHWLAAFTPLPDSRHWRGWQDLRDAAPDACPRWRLAGGELRRHARRVLWLEPGWLHARPLLAQPWPRPEQPLELAGNGRVWFEGNAPSGPLTIGYRQGGERVWMAGRGHRDLKRLLQEAGIPEFLRGRLPLLWRDGQLLAVANLPNLGEAGSRLCWNPGCSPA